MGGSCRLILAGAGFLLLDKPMAIPTMRGAGG